MYPVAGLREHRGPVLERLEIGPMQLVHLGLGGLDGHHWIGVTGGADRGQAQVVAHR